MKTRIVSGTKYNFPDNMSDDDIVKVLQDQNVIPKDTVQDTTKITPTSKPSLLDRLGNTYLGKAAKGIAHGVSSVMETIGEPLAQGIQTAVTNTQNNPDNPLINPLTKEQTQAVLPRETEVLSKGAPKSRAALAGVFDVTSLPQRAAMATYHKLNPLDNKTTFREELAKTKTGNIVGDIIRDPTTLLYAAGPVAGPIAAAAGNMLETKTMNPDVPTSDLLASGAIQAGTGIIGGKILGAVGSRLPSGSKVLNKIRASDIIQKFKKAGGAEAKGANYSNLKEFNLSSSNVKDLSKDIKNTFEETSNLKSNYTNLNHEPNFNTNLEDELMGTRNAGIDKTGKVVDKPSILDDIQNKHPNVDVKEIILGKPPKLGEGGKIIDEQPGLHKKFVDTRINNGKIVDPTDMTPGNLKDYVDFIDDKINYNKVPGSTLTPEQRVLKDYRYKINEILKDKLKNVTSGDIYKSKLLNQFDDVLSPNSKSVTEVLTKPPVPATNENSLLTPSTKVQKFINKKYNTNENMSFDEIQEVQSKLEPFRKQILKFNKKGLDDNLTLDDINNFISNSNLDAVGALIRTGLIAKGVVKGGIHTANASRMPLKVLLQSIGARQSGHE